MNGSRVPLLALAAALLAAVVVPAWADDMTPRPQKSFTEKPRIEDYADYSAFLVDAMEYRRQQKNAPAAAPAGAAPAANPEDIRALYLITGPETIDDAVARAQKLPHPVYEEQLRYDRTTAQSFPLPPLGQPDLVSAQVADALPPLASVPPPRQQRDESAEAYVEEEAPDELPEADERNRNLRDKQDRPATVAVNPDPPDNMVIDFTYTRDGVAIPTGTAYREIRIEYRH